MTNAITIKRSIGILCLFYALLAIEGKKSRQCEASDQNGNLEKWIVYKGGVVEYAPFVRWTNEGGRRILEENTNAYVAFAHLAKSQDVDILVYPEYGLTGLELRMKEAELKTLSQRVSPPGKDNIPCFDTEEPYTYSALLNLSCTARSLRMYMVVNLLEWYEENPMNESGNYFNTMVVFNRKGAVIARYRKNHLLSEAPLIPGTEDPSTALFTTNFGVVFSLQTGFDIMHEEPGLHNIIGEDVKDSIISTAWVDDLPFHTGPQMFSGWSRGLGVNLLVSNYHNPDNGGMGCGIFSGLDPFPMSYIHNEESHSRVIVKEILTMNTAKRVSKKQKNPFPVVGLIVGKIHHTNPPLMVDSNFINSFEYRTGTGNASYQNVIHQDLSNYTSEPLTVPELKITSERTICHDSFCCKAIYSIRYEVIENVTYHLIAYSGLDSKTDGETKIYVQKCAVVFCTDEKVESCAQMDSPVALENGFRLYSLTGMFDTEFIFPSLLKLDFHIADSDDWGYEREYDGKWNATIVTKTRLKNLLTASLFARLYEKDPELIID